MSGMPTPTESAMSDHKIVSHEEWTTTRTAFLAKEKEFTRLREELARERRELPWEHVSKQYVFQSERGRETLADLFDGRTQLIVYHFMFEPEWDIGCRGCSYWADSFNGVIAHLNQRDVTLVAVSRAPLEKLQAQARQFGWTFKWVSSVGDDFNQDYNVWFSPEVLARNEASHNYGSEKVSMPSKPGISSFLKDGPHVFHTYSTYGRGIDMMNTAYQYLDIAPKGRDEAGLTFPMAWVKHRIAYGA
jgi:predicted dithiol-disulfide oxidoreductase (DUF899 family)